jgi:hypothetical protein
MEKPLREGGREQPRGKGPGDSKERAWVRGEPFKFTIQHTALAEFEALLLLPIQ